MLALATLLLAETLASWIDLLADLEAEAIDLEASTLAWDTLFDLSKAAEWLDFDSEEAVALAADETELAKLEADFEPV